MKSIASQEEGNKVQSRNEEFLSSFRENTAVTATLATFNDCLGSLPGFNVDLMLTSVAIVCGWMRSLSKDYREVPCDFYTLSGGGYYVVPRITGTMRIETSGHFYDYEGEVSPDAAGIIASLFTFRSLEKMFPENRLADLYQWLFEYVQYHPESSEIYRAIYRV